VGREQFVGVVQVVTFEQADHESGGVLVELEDLQLGPEIVRLERVRLDERVPAVHPVLGHESALGGEPGEAPELNVQLEALKAFCLLALALLVALGADVLLAILAAPEPLDFGVGYLAALADDILLANVATHVAEFVLVLGELILAAELVVKLTVELVFVRLVS